MGDRLVRKGLVIGIIVLFIGTNFVSGLHIQLKNTTIPLINTRGNTLYVGGDGPNNYSSIQDAIDDAIDCDTVFVFNGTYYEAIDVDKSINLIGEDRDITKIINEYEDFYTVDISADFVNISGFTILSYGFDRYGWGLISVGSCNNTISDNVIKGVWDEYETGIALSGYNNNNTIIGNIILDNGYGIYISSSSNNSIKNNNFSGNWVSIDAYYSNNNIIMDNNFSKNQHDIILEDNCVNNIISSNTFSNIECCVCINLRYSSNKNIVMNNNIISVPGGNGILIQYSKENIIIGNTIKNLKWQNGIYLWSATENTITSNNLICCNAGISSYKNGPSNDNTIHHNNFFDNTQNAYDECSNEWDNGYPSGGNYWDNYSGEDNDGDGIGDTPYNISGGDNQDRYPLMEPWGDNLFPIAKFTWTPPLPEPNETILFNASESFDYDGNIILYEWDWNNDGIFDENHTSPTATHIYEEVGYYLVTLRITDNDNLKVSKTKTVRVGNHPPLTPIIDGPTHGKVGVEYQYNFSIFDPDDDRIYLRVDWGNGTSGPWQGLYDSDTIVKINYTWNQKGTFNIKAQVKDIFDAESDWTSFEVTISKSKAINYNSLFLKLLENFPLLERLLLMHQA